VSDITEQLTTALAGRYTIERELGSGATAVVYVALDQKHERRVALKALRLAIAAALGHQRFLGEIKTRQPAPSAHPAPLRLRGSRGVSLLRDAVRRGRVPARPASAREGSCRSTMRSGSPVRSGMH